MQALQRRIRPRQDTRCKTTVKLVGALFASGACLAISCALQGTNAEHDMNKATAGGQKEGAKGSFAAAKVWRQDWYTYAAIPCCTYSDQAVSLQEHISEAAGHAKEQLSSKTNKNKAGAQTSAYNTRSKAANKLDPDT